jgi:hypothetical protein
MRARDLMTATLATALLATSLVACSSSNQGGVDGGPHPDAEEAGPCAPFSGKRFVSLEMLECGIGTTCYWHVAFSTDGTLYWQHSDVGESATYVCNNNSVTGTTGGGVTLTGQWDPKTARLSWMGTTYKVEAP